MNIFCDDCQKPFFTPVDYVDQDNIYQRGVCPYCKGKKFSPFTSEKKKVFYRIKKLKRIVQ